MTGWSLYCPMIFVRCALLFDIHNSFLDQRRIAIEEPPMHTVRTSTLARLHAYFALFCVACPTYVRLIFGISYRWYSMGHSDGLSLCTQCKRIIDCSSLS